MSNNDVEFPNGLYFNEPNENAPDFVKGKLSIKVDDFQKYLNGKDDEWINIDLKVSRKGKAYAQINDFEPKKQKPPADNDAPIDSNVNMGDGLDDIDDNLPF